ncbi:MAG TPA: DUF5686 and carboxypeptidase regulatory-like domain-containing protein, partial [Flavobacterium sp.]|nr:DUF5686 and carboxypeptidase regulatory-like domain-containing protein [Flavobacterium sp.]
MNKLSIVLSMLLLMTLNAFSQIKGTVKDDHGNPLPFVNIFVENTYNSTISNEAGSYELNVSKPGNYTIIFQYLGFKTLKRSISTDILPFVLNVALVEENFTLNEVVINPNDNPAIEIIRNAIRNKRENSEKLSRYRADFYSRGIFRIKDAPKTILGQKLDMFDDMLDSTRSGILYLSETVSRLTFQKPDKMKEVIVASKVSGNDNGFSFNNAASVNFDLYENYLPFAVNVVSPIADNAFNYYRYKLEGTFFDENNQQISKIKVTPRREAEPVGSGYIYIVDDSWAIYAAELTLTGKSIQNPALNTMTLKQNFSYNNLNKIWVKSTQTLDFDAGILGIKIDGRFTYVYNNFEFAESFDKKTFTKEVLAFEKDANKKDDTFWETVRPVPLTDEESNDYVKKDILQTKKKSQVYLDSIDKVSNKFGLMDVISGYSYKNSFRKWSLNYDGVMTGVSFNTVQGYRINTGFSFVKSNEDKRTYTSIYTRLDYGFSEHRFRPVLGFTHKFNNVDDSQLDVSAGSSVAQFNPSNPISPLVNTISSLFFKDNYMKLYERNFAKAAFGREMINGLHLLASLDYSERKPLFNNTNQSTVKKDKPYTSNNPLLPFDYESPALAKHHLYKAILTARINFAQEYWSRPDGKFNMSNDKYPTLFVAAEKGFAANEKRYEFEHVSARLEYDIT